MDDITLTQLWKTQQEQLAKTQQLNLLLVTHLQQVKAKSQLGSVARVKSWAVGLGIIWLAFLGLLLYGNRGQNWYFTISVAMIFLFNLWAVIIYIRHLALLKSIDYSRTITETQKKLASLQLSTINATRVLLLQLPFYSTFFWTQELVTGDTRFQLISFPSTLLFTLLAIWLCVNISPKNMGKKWLRTFMNIGPEYKNVVRAGEFLEELENFKK